MTTQQIEYVITLAEERSFVKAAQRLYVTQPALSQFIKNVENEVGARLFERGTTPLRLTEIGEIYIESARRIRKEQNEMEQRIDDLTNMRKGKLTIGTSSFRASCLLPKSVEAFQTKYSGIRLNIVVDQLVNLKNMLYTGDIDLCIESADFDAAKFYSEPLFTERYYMAAPTNHPFCERFKEECLSADDIFNDTEKMYTTKGIKLEDLVGLPFVWMERNAALYDEYRAACRKLDCEPDIKLTANQYETAFHWAHSQIAFSFIPDTLIRFGNHKEHPNYFKINSDFTSKPIQVAMRKNRYVTHTMKVYLKILKELIGVGTWNLNT